MRRGVARPACRRERMLACLQTLISRSTGRSCVRRLRLTNVNLHDNDDYDDDNNDYDALFNLLPSNALRPRPPSCLPASRWHLNPRI